MFSFSHNKFGFQVHFCALMVHGFLLLGYVITMKTVQVAKRKMTVQLLNMQKKVVLNKQGHILSLRTSVTFFC